MAEKGKNSSNCEYGTTEYFHLLVLELEELVREHKSASDYYQDQLAKSHELLGRVIHQLSERWDTVNLTKFFPTDNLSRKRSVNNPTGEKKGR